MFTLVIFSATVVFFWVILFLSRYLKGEYFTFVFVVNLFIQTMLVIYSVGFFFTIKAHADEWKPIDTKREAVYVLLLSADIATTKDAMRSGGYEQNPLIGNHPSANKLNAIYAANIAGHYLIASWL